MDKTVLIYLGDGAGGFTVFTTTKGQIDYVAWGVTATIKDNNDITKVARIPWANIIYVEEFTF